jgi:hypothetical protein
MSAHLVSHETKVIGLRAWPVTLLRRLRIRIYPGEGERAVFKNWLESPCREGRLWQTRGLFEM